MSYILAIILPWAALMAHGRMGQGILCLILQITILGWIPATIWAFVVISNDKADDRHQEVMRTIQNNNNSVYNKPKEYLSMEEKARLFDEMNKK